MKYVWSAALALGLGVGIGWFLQEHHSSTLRHESNPTLQQVQSLADLVLLQVNVADVEVSRLRGRTGGLESILVIRGDAVVGSDLSQARLVSVDLSARRAVLALPVPSVRRPRVDHQRTEIFEVRPSGLWHVLPSGEAERQLLEAALEQAQVAVAQAAQQPEILQRARQRAEQLLVGFFRALDWHVQIQWADRPAGPPASRSAAG